MVTEALLPANRRNAQNIPPGDHGKGIIGRVLGVGRVPGVGRVLGVGRVPRSASSEKPDLQETRTAVGRVPRSASSEKPDMTFEPKPTKRTQTRKREVNGDVGQAPWSLTPKSRTPEVQTPERRNQHASQEFTKRTQFPLLSPRRRPGASHARPYRMRNCQTNPKPLHRENAPNEPNCLWCQATPPDTSAPHFPLAHPPPLPDIPPHESSRTPRHRPRPRHGRLRRGRRQRPHP